MVRSVARGALKKRPLKRASSGNQFKPKRFFDDPLDRIPTMETLSLELIRPEPSNDVQDAVILAGYLVNPQPRPLDRRILSLRERAQLVMAAGLLHIRYTKPLETQLRVAIQFVIGDTISLRERLLEMSRGQHDPKGIRKWTTTSGAPTQTHPFVALAARVELDAPSCAVSLDPTLRSMLYAAQARIAPNVISFRSRADFGGTQAAPV